MSKRQEMRDKRRREKIRNQILVILMVVAGALLITFALVVPGINNIQNSNATATSLAENPVIVITPAEFSAAVDGTHLGDPNAPVKVEIYEDFRCSACAYYTQNIEPLIIQNYVETGIVYYSFRNYIVIDSYDQTTASYNSSLAALCAADQNLFWEMHETLYANQVTEDAELFSDERLAQMAQNVGVDMETFNQCFESKEHEDIMAADDAAGIALQLRGTPSVAVNGVVVTTSVEAISAAIEAALNGQ